MDSSDDLCCRCSADKPRENQKKVYSSSIRGRQCCTLLWSKARSVLSGGQTIQEITKKLQDMNISRDSNWTPSDINDGCLETAKEDDQRRTCWGPLANLFSFFFNPQLHPVLSVSCHLTTNELHLRSFRGGQTRLTQVRFSVGHLDSLTFSYNYIHTHKHISVQSESSLC